MVATSERMESSWPATLRSNSANFCASSRCVATISRSFTKARTTNTLISMARGVFKRLAAMSVPCSVKA